MNLNADLSRRAAMHADSIPWRISPTAGVERRMLERIGEEVAWATSIVRYAPGSRFPEHVHGAGEELIVLEGLFEDEHGAYPAGSYVRNPPGSRHAPGSAAGCVLFVKLRQFHPDDRTHVRIDLNKIAAVADRGRADVRVTPLFADAHEDVRLESWAPDAAVVLTSAVGIEIFVLDGGFEEGGEAFVPHSWLRLPAEAPALIRVGSAGARVWVKTRRRPLPAIAAA